KNGDLRAPYVEIFDARGCDAKNSQYTGPKSGDMNDDQCVKVSMAVPKVSEATAEKKRQEFLGFKETAINVPQIAGKTKKY
uniref:Phycocyanin-645 alpha-1 chain n=1 Tax=Chroomonas sp. TaxID=3029 RepID=PHEA1_CHRSP|nr:RecName: Full=Phycocyanin-645 alpha-1 chain; Short=PC-645 [Chroomonas sp.]